MDLYRDNHICKFTLKKCRNIRKDRDGSRLKGVPSYRIKLQVLIKQVKFHAICVIKQFFFKCVL